TARSAHLSPKIVDREIFYDSFLGNLWETHKMVNTLEAHLGYWLRFVSNHVSHAFSLKLATREVTVAEWVVLRELYDRDAMAPSELATRLGMTRGAISKLADRLVAKSLLTRTSNDAGDRRFQ